MRVKKTTSVTFDFRLDVARDLLVKHHIESDSRFSDLFKDGDVKVHASVENDGEIIKITVIKNDYYK